MKLGKRIKYFSSFPQYQKNPTGSCIRRTQYIPSIGGFYNNLCGRVLEGSEIGYFCLRNKGGG